MFNTMGGAVTHNLLFVHSYSTCTPQWRIDVIIRHENLDLSIRHCLSSKQNKLFKPAYVRTK